MMIKTVKILGKDRELWRTKHGNYWFLNQPKDIGELEIFGSYTLEQWQDPNYLWRISPPRRVLQMKEVIKVK